MSVEKEIKKIGYLEYKTPKRDSKNYFNKCKDIKELSAKDFDKKISFKLKPLKNEYSFIMFYAPWCGYCKQTKDLWMELASSLSTSKGGVNMLAFNCEKNKKYLNKLNLDFQELGKIPLIKSYPTLILYKNGLPHEQFNGERNMKNLKNFLKQ